MDPNIAMLWSALAAAVTALVAVLGLGITLVRTMLTSASKRGAQTEREKQLNDRIDKMEKVGNERHDQVQARIASVETNHNTVATALAVLTESVSAVRHDLTDVKTGVATLGRDLESNFRDLMAQNHHPIARTPG